MSTMRGTELPLTVKQVRALPVDGSAILAPSTGTGGVDYAAGGDSIFNVGVLTAFATKITIPANTPAGTKISFIFAGTLYDWTGGGNVTLTLKVGSLTFFVSAAEAGSTDATFVVEGFITVVATGAIGKVTGAAHTKNSWMSGIGISNGNIVRGAVNLSADVDITLSATPTVAHVRNVLDLTLCQSERRLVQS